MFGTEDSTQKVVFKCTYNLATIGFIDRGKQGFCFDLRVQHFVFGYTSSSIVILNQCIWYKVGAMFM